MKQPNYRNAVIQLMVLGQVNGLAQEGWCSEDFKDQSELLRCAKIFIEDMTEETLQEICEKHIQQGYVSNEEIDELLYPKPEPKAISNNDIWNK